MVRATGHTRVNGLGRLWPWYIALVMLLTSSGLPRSTDAAERTRPIRIGALTDSWGFTPQMAGLRAGLLELGYREREDFVIGVRFTQGNPDALAAAARGLVQYGVDLIFATNALAAKAAQQATRQIPVVFAGAIDPLKLGLVQSFARPGSNVTGVADLNLGLGPKRLEVFLDIVPDLKRILFLYPTTDPFAISELRVYRDAARHLGIAFVEKAIASEEEAQRTVAAVRKGAVDGILSPRCCAWNLPGFIIEAAAQQAISTMFYSAFFVELGALASYGPDFYETGRQAARLVDKILKGANPADIPVEVNSKIEFVINLKTAKALGLTIPPEMLYQANRVIR